MTSLISKTTLRLATAALAIMALTACNENQEAGPVISESRSIPYYHQIEVNADFSVYISENNGSGVRVIAPDNRMQFIETYVAGGKLIIRERGNDIEKRDIVRVEISQISLSEIELSGSGSITGDEIITASTSVLVNGSGSIDLSFDVNSLGAEVKGSGSIKSYGATKIFNAKVKGSGSIAARNLESITADAKVDGSGLIELYATESLYAIINGSGNIRYWGNPPNVNSQISGSGRVRAM